MDLKDLYRDVILDHNRRPRNFGRTIAGPAILAGWSRPTRAPTATILCAETG
jgi:hypothetical protein